MTQKAFSIRDSKAGVFNTPFFQKSIGEAERSFDKLTKDSSSMVYQYPDDYDLYYIGEYDDQSGNIKPLDTPQHILKAVNTKHLKALSEGQL